MKFIMKFIIGIGPFDYGGQEDPQSAICKHGEPGKMVV